MRLEDTLQRLVEVIGPALRDGDDPCGQLLARDWAGPDTEGHRWRSLALYAADQVTVRLPGTRANRGHFATEGSDPKTSRPQLGLTALIGLPSQLLAQVLISPAEPDRAVTDLAPPDHSLTIFAQRLDRPDLWLRVQASGHERHWIASAGQGPRWRTAKVIDERGGDALVEVRIPPGLRQPDEPPYALLRQIRSSRPGYPVETLITSLVDHHLWPRHEIVAIHSERWVAGPGRPRAQRGRRPVLSGDEPETVYAHLWALLWGYNLVRAELYAGAESASVDPARLDVAAALEHLDPEALREAIRRADRAPLGGWRRRVAEWLEAPVSSPVKVRLTART